MKRRWKTKAHKVKRPPAAASAYRRAHKTLAAEADLIWQARIETLGNFAARLGHEARNLLGALGTCVQILRRSPQLSQEDAELLDIIQSGSRRLSELVSEVSIFRNSTPLHLQDVDLRELIEESLVVLERDRRWHSSIAVRREFDPSAGQIKGDRDQLGQALRHLLLNAVEAMVNQGELGVKTQRAGGEVKVVIQDTGAAIPKRDLGKIFEPFYSARAGSAGIGLAAARYIVEKHGGRIAARSEASKGTRFTVRLPVRNSGR